MEKNEKEINHPYTCFECYYDKWNYTHMAHLAVGKRTMKKILFLTRQKKNH